MEEFYIVTIMYGSKSVNYGKVRAHKEYSEQDLKDCLNEIKDSPYETLISCVKVTTNITIQPMTVIF